MAQLLVRPALPTAIFAEYDELAIGALWALRRSGLSVPADMSIIGIDDHEMAAMVDLTTVAQDVPAQGATAAQLLLRLIEGEEVPRYAPVTIPTKLILRASTAPPRTKHGGDQTIKRRSRRRRRDRR